MLRTVLGQPAARFLPLLNAFCYRVLTLCLWGVHELRSLFRQPSNGYGVALLEIRHLCGKLRKHFMYRISGRS